MRREPHPINGMIYEEVGDGTVRVQDAANNLSGLFRWDGAWLEGDLTYADPHMLHYIGGPDLPPGRDIFWTLLPVTDDAPPPAFTTNPGRSGGGNAAQRPKIIAPYKADDGIETPEGARASSHIPLEVFLESDRRPDLIPEIYRRSSPLPGGPKKVSTARFFEQKYHDLEVEKLWKTTWQMACREDDIPEVGDYHIYEIANLSYLIVRTGEHEFKAHVNACLHRGRSLRSCHGRKARDFRCPYHGWSWKIDGSLKEIPAEWDFPGVREDVSQLPGAKVATWGGFVFINPDPKAGPLEDHMGPEMLQHYAKVKLENRYKQAHVVKVIRANWKVAMEAFLESYHTIATHPQLLLGGGDLSDTRDDVFGYWGRLGHVNISASSPLRGIIAPPARAVEAYQAMADFNRAYLRGLIGDEVEQFSDAELNEQTFNNLFPNFSPWGGWARIVYRFRPNGSNPEECLMDIMLLAPWPEGKPKPLARPARQLGADEPWTTAPELGTLAKIADQDTANMVAVQKGLRTKVPEHLWYSTYQESIIRNFHTIYERKLGLSDGE